MNNNWDPTDYLYSMWKMRDDGDFTFYITNSYMTVFLNTRDDHWEYVGDYYDYYDESYWTLSMCKWCISFYCIFCDHYGIRYDMPVEESVKRHKIQKIQLTP